MAADGICNIQEDSVTLKSGNDFDGIIDGLNSFHCHFKSHHWGKEITISKWMEVNNSNIADVNDDL